MGLLQFRVCFYRIFFFIFWLFFFGFSEESLKHKIFSNGYIVENNFFFVVLQRLYYEGRRGFSNFLLMNSLQLNLLKNS